MRRLLTAALALLVVACGGESTSTTPSVDSAVSSSSMADETATTVSIVPTTTTPVDSTTVAGTTTSSGPTTTRFAVVVSIEGALGWYDGNTWVQAQDSLPVEGGETYQVHRIGAESTQVIGVETDGGCELVQPSIGVRFDPDPFAGGLDIFGPNPIAISAPWDTSPHGAFPIETTPTYQEIASGLLADIGVDDPEPRFAQMLRTDIDGDGVDEVFAVAERRSDPSGALLGAPAGDYSVAFARVVVGEEARTFVLGEWVVSEPDEQGFSSDLVIYRFDAFLDADADGTDELALRTTYYEGSGVALLDYLGPDQGFDDVISAVCGA